MNKIIQPWIAPKEQFCQIGYKIWSVPTLIDHAKSLDVFDLPLRHMGLSYQYDISMRDMVMHMRAVLDADLSYPIILDEEGTIMDGRHRVMKALLEGATTIRAVRFDVNPSPCRYA